MIRRIRTPFWVVTFALFSAPLSSPAWAQAPAPSAGDLVDLNTASLEQLEALPGVGPATAKRIIEGRPYGSIDDLKSAGLIPTAIDKIRPLVAVKSTGAEKPAGKPETKKSETKPTAAGLIDINNATSAELDTLPGIGPAMAQAIIDDRPFATIDELDRVKGIGAAKLAAIRERITVGPMTGTPRPKSDVAKVASKAKSKAATATPAKKVNINSASLDDLDTLPGIGPAKAQAIVAGRPFKSIEAIKDVKGIGDATFAKLKDLITIDK